MHRSKIEYCDDTWNPVTGCLCDCSYCYSRTRTSRFSGDIRRNKKTIWYEEGKDIQVLEGPLFSENGGYLNTPFGFEPTYHRYRLDYPSQRKRPSTVLVCEEGELFGDWVPDHIIKEIFESCKKEPQHKYLFLTKNPDRLVFSSWIADEFRQNRNWWIGQTVTGEGDFSGLPNMDGEMGNVFLNLEPLMNDFEDYLILHKIKWVVVGSETGSRADKIVPEKEWIENIIRECREEGVPVFLKNSLAGIWGGSLIQEYPEGLKAGGLSLLEKNRFEEDCSICGVHNRKKDMIALSARSVRGEQPRQFCYMCHVCFKYFCNQYNISIPRLEGMEGEEEKLPQDGA